MNFLTLLIINRIGVTSGVIELRYGAVNDVPALVIEFYDENTGVDYILETMKLAEYSTIKESYVIGDINLKRIKNSKVADLAKKFLLEKGKNLEKDVVRRAKEFANEIKERSAISVKVIPEIEGEPEVLTEFGYNMWHARQSLLGVDDDY
ncbi:hypothetical protein LCL95_09965 [Bacillus timonensis]|nr:hypothetical protein [Bacillus timonensis]